MLECLVSKFSKIPKCITKKVPGNFFSKIVEGRQWTLFSDHDLRTGPPGNKNKKGMKSSNMQHWRGRAPHSPGIT